MLLLLAMMAAAPPRPTGLDVPTNQSVDALHQCITHRWGGSFEDKELENGVAVTLGSSTNLIGMHRTGPLTFAITDAGQTRHVTVLYRHPLSQGTAAKNLRVFGRKCFPYELNAAGLEKTAINAD